MVYTRYLARPAWLVTNTTDILRSIQIVGLDFVVRYRAGKSNSADLLILTIVYVHTVYRMEKSTVLRRLHMHTLQSAELPSSSLQATLAWPLLCMGHDGMVEDRVRESKRSDGDSDGSII
jgi:hypothetical protein